MNKFLTLPINGLKQYNNYRHNNDRGSLVFITGFHETRRIHLTHIYSIYIVWFQVFSVRLCFGFNRIEMTADPWAYTIDRYVDGETHTRMLVSLYTFAAYQ